LLCETFWPSTRLLERRTIEEEIVVRKRARNHYALSAENMVAGAHYFTVDGPLASIVNEAKRQPPMEGKW